MIEVGKQAPNFELASHLAGTKFSLGQSNGEKNVMLVFYPLDWTPSDFAQFSWENRLSVRYSVSVTPAGQRNPSDLLAECQKINKG